MPERVKDLWASPFYWALNSMVRVSGVPGAICDERFCRALCYCLGYLQPRVDIEVDSISRNRVF
jgi:hypothetical protein